MAHIIFYEKPGCINNTKQKRWLEAAGHAVEAVNLLEHEWSQKTLKMFFGEKPVAECFNSTAPAIKNGEINPTALSETAAFEAMIGNPILIGRPLINIDNTHYLQGFDKHKIDQLIGLTAIPGAEDVVSELNKDDLTTCPQLAQNTSCDEINAPQNTKPLGTLIEIVEKMGLQVTYAYDDLVFVEHSAFIFQFAKNKGIDIYFSTDCPESEAQKIFLDVTTYAKQKGLDIHRKGTFRMRQKEGEENIELEFQPIV